jgi:hypothetical protein
MIDAVVSLRSGRRIRWDQNPYQKADETEKCAAGLFMALCPIVFLIFFGSAEFFESWVDSMIYGHHSIIWLYLGFIGAVCFWTFYPYEGRAESAPVFISPNRCRDVAGFSVVRLDALDLEMKSC